MKQIVFFKKISYPEGKRLLPKSSRDSYSVRSNEIIIFLLQIQVILFLLPCLTVKMVF
uniref:Uncharacterized protein n=1 Tax=Lepeophtheirus salmonis TaxID=72036 RepID=A0A0K2TCC6_LEPSM